MEQTRLVLLNFRSHGRSEIVFDGRPVVITGENGAGKTNLLEAISMFSPGRGLRRAERDALAKQPENLGWKLSLIGENFRIDQSAPMGEGREVRINDKTAAQLHMGDYLRQVWMLPTQDRIWLDSASERRRFFDRIVLSFVGDHGEKVMQYEKAMRERNRLLKDDVGDRHWYEAIEARMHESAVQIVANRAQVIEALNEEMQAAKSVFPIAKLSLDYGDVDQNWAANWAESRSADRYAGTTRTGPHKVNFDAEYVAKSQRAALCSTGEQKALLISLFLANARALIQRGHIVFLLLDEAVAHLDEGRRATLLADLAELDAQVVMTGTESALFEALDKRGKFVVVAEENGVSHVLEDG